MEMQSSLETPRPTSLLSRCFKMAFHCKLQPVQGCQEPGFERCVTCGYLFVPADSAETRVRECSHTWNRSVAELPSYMAMAGRWVQAWAKWRAEGKPVVQFTVIVKNFRQCSKCPQYSDLTGQCIKCGCFVNLLHNGQGMNKLEWATEHCPDTPPRWDNRKQ